MPTGNTASATSYWKTASDFLYAALQHIRKPIKSISGSDSFFIFTKEQEEGLQHLSAILNPDYSPELGEKAVFDTLELLFFEPYQDRWALNKFRAPLTAFFALCLLLERKDGDSWQFGPPQHGTAKWARIQSCMRLTMFHQFQMRVLRKGMCKA